MSDDEDLEESWKVLERTHIERTSPHTMNVAEAIERIIVAVEEFHKVLKIGQLVDHPGVIVRPRTIKGEILWEAGVEFRFAGCGDAIRSHSKPSIEAALEDLFQACLKVFHKSLTNQQLKMERLRSELAEEEGTARKLEGVIMTMGKYTPYQMNLPSLGSEPSDVV